MDHKESVAELTFHSFASKAHTDLFFWQSHSLGIIKLIRFVTQGTGRLYIRIPSPEERHQLWLWFDSNPGIST